jgi:hypothetical protein
MTAYGRIEMGDVPDVKSKGGRGNLREPKIKGEREREDPFEVSV